MTLILASKKHQFSVKNVVFVCNFVQKYHFLHKNYSSKHKFAFLTKISVITTTMTFSKSEKGKSGCLKGAYESCPYRIKKNFAIFSNETHSLVFTHVQRHDTCHYTRHDACHDMHHDAAL